MRPLLSFRITHNTTLSSKNRLSTGILTILLCLKGIRFLDFDRFLLPAFEERATDDPDLLPLLAFFNALSAKSVYSSQWHVPSQPK